MVAATWSGHHLDSLDTTSKGLRDVHIEPRGPADLWIRGSGTLDGPADEWSFEEEAVPSKAIGSELNSGRTEELVERERISYPLRVRFEVALADQPEYLLTSAALRHHHKTFQHLSSSAQFRSKCTTSIALYDYPEGLWVFSIDRQDEILPVWWDRQVRSRIRPLGEIKEEVRQEGYGRRPSVSLNGASSPSSPMADQHVFPSPHGHAHPRPGDPTLVSSRPQPPTSTHRSGNSAEGVPPLGPKRAVYDDTDEDEEIKCAAERQWVLAVDVLIQMADWVSTLHDRDHRLLMCRPRYFTVRYSAPSRLTAAATGRQDFNLELRTFATVEQAGMLGKTEYSAEAGDSSPLNLNLNSASKSDLKKEEGSPFYEEAPTRKGLVKQLVEHGLRANLGYVAPEFIAADYTADPSVDVFAWGVAAYELLADRPIENFDVGQEDWDMLTAIHHHSTRKITSLGDIHDTIPSELSQLVEKALALDPSDRYLNASTLLHDLHVVRQICAGQMSDEARADFVIGDIIELATFKFPPDLLDREAEEVQLDAIYTRIKLSGTPEVACCYGRSGSGKSQLIADWATRQEMKNAGQDCLVGTAKLDQHLLRPLSGFISVFCSLLDRVFSDPLEDPVAWKKDILNAVTANSNLFLSLLPAEWQRVLGDDSTPDHVPSETQAIDWDSYIKQFRSWATMLLRLFASRHRPLILVIDDYQWMEVSERTLWYELAFVPSRRVEHCFFVLSYRTTEQTLAPDIEPVKATMIEARRFDRGVLLTLLTKCFHLDGMSTEWRELADSLLETSEGNPLFCNQILVAYVRDKVIQFDYDTRKWQIQREAMTNYDAMSSEQYSGRTFSLFEPELKDALQRLAWLPSRGVKLHLLARVVASHVDHLKQCLKPAVDSNVIRITNGEVVFSHDRHHLAVMGSIPEDNKAVLFLSIAEALEGLSSPELMFVRADLLLTAHSLQQSCVSDQMLCRALIQATQRAIRGLASDLAQRYLERARKIWTIDTRAIWEKDPETTLQLVGVIAEVAIARRHAATTLAEVERASGLAPTPLLKIQVLTWLCRLCLACSHAADGCDYVLRAYALANVPSDLWRSAPNDARLIRSYVPLAPVMAVNDKDRTYIALSVITTIMGPTVYAFMPDFGRPVFHAAGTLLLQKPAAAALKFPSSAYIYAIMGLLELNDLNLDVALSWLELSETMDVKGTPYQAAADIARIVVRLIRSRRLSELDYTSIRENCIATKNPDILTYVCGLEFATLGLSGHSITQMLARGKLALAALGEDLQAVSRLMATSFVQMAANLTSQGDPARMSELQGVYVTPACVERVPETAPFYAVCYALASMFLGLLYGVPEADLAKRAALLKHFGHGGNGTILQPMTIVLLAIWTLTTDQPTETDLINVAKAHLGKFTENLNFAAILRLLDSLALLKQVRKREASWSSLIENVEETLLQLHDAEAYLLQGLLCARVSAVLVTVGPVPARLANGYRRSARKAFEQCGASNLVKALDGADADDQRTVPTVVPEGVLSECQSPATTSSKSILEEETLSVPAGPSSLRSKIGLESVLRTSLLLASEKDGEGLIKRVLSVLMQLTRTTYACIAIQDHAQGTLQLRGYGSHDEIEVCEVALAEAGQLCPASLLLHVSVTKKAINTTTAGETVHNKLFEREPFFKSTGVPKSIIVAPLFVQGRLSGAIYLANRAVVPTSSTSHVGLLATFAAIILKSHHAYATLEAAVETRTNQLEQALAHRQTFINAISHELRTPLFAVAGLCSVMENSDDLPINLRENVSIIRQSSDDLQRIVTAVLDWSKLDAGSVQAECIDFDLRSIVEAATVTVGHIAQAKSVELVIENSVDTDPTTKLLGDPHRYRQCLLNILSNALKFTPLAHGDATPTVRIRWTLDERADAVDITLAIQDEGIGIPRRAMNKLFGAFVQGHSGISRSHGGSGLGLSITRGLCRVMGGDCWAESVEGKGSTFYLLITVKKEQKSHLSLWSQAVHSPQQAVLVTAHPSRFLSLTRNLQTWNIETGIEETIGELINQTTKTPPYDLVIVDIVAEGLGDDVVLELRRVCAKAKLVLLVGPLEAESYKKRTDQESWTVLSKPCTAMALYCATVRQLSSPGNQSVSRPSSPSADSRSMVPKRTAHAGGAMKKSGMDNRYALTYPLRILYVDDSTVNVKVGLKILEKFGYKGVDTAEDGRIAVAAAAKVDYDLILMDLQMPTMDGYTARNIIYQKDPSNCPAIVALTANTDEETRERCQKDGFFYFLSKPLRIADLANVLRLAHTDRQTVKTPI